MGVRNRERVGPSVGVGRFKFSQPIDIIFIPPEAQTTLQKLPSPSHYRQALVLNGHADGFRSTMVASITPSDSPAYALVTGYWVLAYVGEHPPVLNQYRLTGIADPGYDMIIAGKGGRQWRPKQVGRHRYLYWIVRWNRTELTAFPPGQSRRELQTSEITLRFAGGGQTTMADHQRPAVASPWNSPYWLRGNPPALNVRQATTAVRDRGGRAPGTGRLAVWLELTRHGHGSDHGRHYDVAKWP